jgi:uncharacterized membrane protein
MLSTQQGMFIFCESISVSVVLCVTLKKCRGVCVFGYLCLFVCVCYIVLRQEKKISSTSSRINYSKKYSKTHKKEKNVFVVLLSLLAVSSCFSVLSPTMPQGNP